MFFYPNKPIQIYDIEKLIPELGDLVWWGLQPKWNGKRIEIHHDGKALRLFSREGREWFLPEWEWLKDIPLPQPWWLDGEVLRDGRIYVWDYALLSGERVYKTQYAPRLAHLCGTLGTEPIIHGDTSLSVIQTTDAMEYPLLLGQQDDPMLEGMVWKNLKATNLWGPHSTTKVSSMFKYRFDG